MESNTSFNPMDTNETIENMRQFGVIARLYIKQGWLVAYQAARRPVDVPGLYQVGLDHFGLSASQIKSAIRLAHSFHNDVEKLHRIRRGGVVNLKLAA